MRLDALTRRYPRLAAMLYLSAVQYFVVQVVVGLRFAPPYSVSRNTISDLGATTCGEFNARPVCSPLHALMNISFVLLGLAMVSGSLLLYHQLPRSGRSALGFGLFAIGGFGVVLVGLFPEDTVSALHGIGAALPFAAGNAGIVLLGVSSALPRGLQAYSVVSGAVALAALVLYAGSHYLGLGEGGIERVVAYPQTLWMIVIGTVLLIARTD